MKKIVFYFLIFITFNSCKKEPQIEYKHNNKKNLFPCSEVKMGLINEAVYSFEKDLLISFEKEGVSNISHAYSLLLGSIETNKINVNSFISRHTKLIFKQLKKQHTLWETSKDQLNINSKLINCIGKTIKDQNIKTTFNALINTNSMSKSLFYKTIYDDMSKITSDPSLKTFIILNYFCTNFYKNTNNE